MEAENDFLRDLRYDEKDLIIRKKHMWYPPPPHKKKYTL